MVYTRPRYGCINKSAVASSIREMPMANAQLVKPGSGCFVFLADGLVTLAITTTDFLFGWALFPQSLKAGSTDAANGYWTSTLVDKVQVITSADAIFRIPCSTGLAVRARVGEHCDLIAANGGAGQVASPGTTSTDVLRIHDIPRDGDDDSILVKMDAVEMQAETP